ncbi:hypothetical protein EDC94DRAFT_665135 [Helicostylum pulchrum]|nr:hypothetical protein EDC94DRAFT_665135 [Helicostylum pulchrum]
MNNSQKSTSIEVNNEGTQRMVDNSSAMHRSNQMIIAQGMSRRPNGTLVKEVRGTAVCSNKHCILALKHEIHKGRHAVSATAICISGSAMLLLKMQHPSFCYNDYNSETNTDDFRKKAEVFLNRNTSRPAIDDSITREI